MLNRDRLTFDHTFKFGLSITYFNLAILHLSKTRTMAYLMWYLPGRQELFMLSSNNTDQYKTCILIYFSFS